MAKKVSTTTPVKGPVRTHLEKLERILPWVLIVCGIIGIIASLAITMEKFDLLKNPNYHPVCDLNPIISCGSVMQSKQANAFGFMNTYIGLLGFPVVLAVGMAMLAGAKFKRWFWLGMQIGLTLGVIFAYWLLWQSIYRIRALCPYCLSIDIVITAAFWYVTQFMIRQKFLVLPKQFNKVVAFSRNHHLDILISWYLIVIIIILQHFWYYFGQHL